MDDIRKVIVVVGINRIEHQKWDLAQYGLQSIRAFKGDSNDIL